MKEPTLYGIEHSNRQKIDFWGKNQFNSSFPLSLACYMRDNNLNPIYIKLNQNLNIELEEISFDEVFNSKLPNKKLYFSFESKYDPYQEYSFDDIQGIDLVVKDLENTFLRPLEVKLTVIPDSSTFRQAEANWGTEIVIRPATTKYCSMGMFDSCKNHIAKIREIFEPVCHNIQHWTNQYEILSRIHDIKNAIDIFEIEFITKQKPFLMQPIWKTKGKSPILADQAFDIFIWSDFALSRLFVDYALANKDKITRLTRSTARLGRFLYEISSRKKTHLTQIYTDMAFGRQTDKEFSVNGSITKNYMKCDRKLKPILHKDIIKKIILHGGENLLSPERRFDQTIYFTIANK